MSTPTVMHGVDLSGSSVVSINSFVNSGPTTNTFKTCSKSYLKDGGTIFIGNEAEQKAKAIGATTTYLNPFDPDLSQDGQEALYLILNELVRQGDSTFRVPVYFTRPMEPALDSSTVHYTTEHVLLALGRLGYFGDSLFPGVALLSKLNRQSNTVAVVMSTDSVDASVQLSDGAIVIDFTSVRGGHYMDVEAAEVAMVSVAEAREERLKGFDLTAPQSTLQEVIANIFAKVIYYNITLLKSSFENNSLVKSRQYDLVFSGEVVAMKNFADLARGVYTDNFSADPLFGIRSIEVERYPGTAVAEGLIAL